MHWLAAHDITHPPTETAGRKRYPPRDTGGCYAASTSVRISQTLHTVVRRCTEQGTRVQFHRSRSSAATALANAHRGQESVAPSSPRSDVMRLVGRRTMALTSTDGSLTSHSGIPHRELHLPV
jgi:hypothetical protein